MSQHLINDFIHRTPIFKAINGGKIANGKVVKYQASNRKNNNSPEDIEESVHYLKPIKVTQQTKKEPEEKLEHIDVLI